MDFEEYETLEEYVEKIKKAFNEKDYYELSNNLYLLEHSLKHFKYRKKKHHR